ncbi:MAG: class I adenylate-forming enzyme family protein [Acidimicrobiales bacterium]|nr:class I adenylate-forming enzyme family protein [Acidimicrobiales bacterium]MDP6299413.1 class I adenylate-forming enzyme family protein [Acidimicrobiales bacterium]HJM28205.1 class I adenylate-forming enzyme family protein [Acidimicrobiales bacterium]
MDEEHKWINVTTLGDLIDMRADEYEDQPAIIFPESTDTYRSLAERAQFYAKGLLALNVESGDRIGYFLHECVETISIILGAAKIGAIAVPINGRFKPTELRQVIVHAGIKVLFSSQPSNGTNFISVIQETFTELDSCEDSTLDLVEAPNLKHLVSLGKNEHPSILDMQSFSNLVESISENDIQERQQAVRVRSTSVIMYTSGTTAMPKGAMMSHESFLRYAESTRKRMKLTSDDSFWTALPMFHIGGVGFVIASIYAGCTYYHPGFFDPAVALSQLRDGKCTVSMPGFPTIWMPILNHPDRTEDCLSSLRLVMSSGVEERLRQMQKMVPNATVVSCFGMTEVCAFLSLSELDDPEDVRMTTGGLPMPGMEAEVRDPETGEVLPFGSTGEAWVTGPNMFDGYFREPELTEQVFDERGYFRTGDIANIDEDGRVTFVGRLKDMLKVGGENVAAAEVEGYLLTHPDIDMAQVVAAPDAKYVEVPAAYIQLKPGSTTTEQEIIDFCRGQIATYRVPRYIRFIEEYPMSASKVKKFVLRDMIKEELEAKGITEAPKIAST